MLKGEYITQGQRRAVPSQEFPVFPYQHLQDSLVPVAMVDHGKEDSSPSSSGPKGSWVCLFKADDATSTSAGKHRALGGLEWSNCARQREKYQARSWHCFL